MKHASIPTFILMAEDDVSYGEALAGLLRRAGHVVRHVTDGEDAVLALRMHAHRISLVLTDLLLPRRSGFEVAREALEAGVDAPVLVMTGVNDDRRDMHALRMLGVKGWIHKSAPLDHVLFRVNALLWPATSNARDSARVAVAVPVQFRMNGRVHYATTYNLSASGVYVRTNEPVQDGDRLELALSLPSAREMITLPAEIVHAASVEEVQGTGYPAGFGARFCEPSPLALAAVRNFVEGLVVEEEALGVPEGAALAVSEQPEPVLV